MKQSKVFIPTMRDVPSEAEAQSHRLLLKSGLIKQSTSGIYSYLPLATRVLNNITAIVVTHKTKKNIILRCLKSIDKTVNILLIENSNYFKERDLNNENN